MKAPGQVTVVTGPNNASVQSSLAIVAYAFGPSAAFDGLALVLALGLGAATFAKLSRQEPRQAQE